VDEALLKWFKQQKSDNVPVSGPLLMVKAEEFAKKLKDEEFVCSAGWIDRFQLRHNITFGKVSGGSGSAHFSYNDIRL
jgi:predicted alpha-1,6-mannanase (GH76 family)